MRGYTTAGRTLGLVLLGASGLAQGQFINELHYDNSGTDVGEAVEVLAPAGTSLAGWSIALYNGGDGKRYATLALSGTVANQCSGYGTVVANAPGIQNGNPDGLALVNASGQVVQFLSYGGSFTATDGPAQGQLSTAIPQSESSSTAVGHSLRLAGSGSQYSQFSWQAPAASSFGACNAGQTLAGGGSGGGGSSVLNNNVALTGLGAATGASLNYTFELPAGASNLVVALSGGSGDADLYLKRGSAPTTSSYDCRPYQTGNNESCSIAAPGSGTWHVSLRAYTTFSGASLVARWTLPSGGGGSSVLQKGVPVTGLAATSGNSLAYTIEVPTGASNLVVSTSGSSGDADLYLRRGSAPTTSTYDCRSYSNGSNESCTVASPASGTWHVMVRAYTSFSGLSLVGDYTAATGGGGTPGGYYSGVTTSSSSALRSSLHAVIDDHTKIPYTASTTDTWDVLNVADQDPLDAGRVLDIYKNQSYAKAPGGNDLYNREHTWPKSLGFPDDGAGNYPYTDLHMLMVSEIQYNAARGNLPFGNCTSSCTEYPTQAYAGQGGGSGSFPGNSNWSNGQVWQVWRKLKGNVARAMFYMDLRYEGGTHGVTAVAEPDLRLTDTMSLVTGSSGNASVAYMGALSVLLQWHAEDPVDEAERLRNDAVYSYQGNRNPFVDNPAWVDCVYRNICQ